MSSKEPRSPRPQAEIETFPFETAAEAWFWFIQAQQAKEDGARFSAQMGLLARPCEPLDILKVLDRLYRKRRLLMDHIMVLRHYGRRKMAPDPRRTKELRAHKLWTDALERIETVLVAKRIVKKVSHWSDVIPFSQNRTQESQWPELHGEAAE